MCVCVGVVMGSGLLRCNLQAKLQLPRSELSVLLAGSGCFSSLLVTSFQSNAHTGWEQSPYAMLQYAAVFLQCGISLKFTVDEKVGRDLLYLSLLEGACAFLADALPNALLTIWVLGIHCFPG